MDIGPGAGDKPNGEWLRHEARLGRLRDGLVAPLHQFFATAAITCPYVPGRAERKLIVELGGVGLPSSTTICRAPGSAAAIISPIARPAAPAIPASPCGSPSSASPTRVRPGASAISSRDLVGRWSAPGRRPSSSACSRPISARATATATWPRCITAITGGWSRTPRSALKSPSSATAGTLVAAALIDRLDDGVSAVYSFYDPQQPKRSLGTWSILWLVEECHRQAQPYVYLGYWIADSPKMAYKARYPALERLVAGGWAAFPRQPSEG